MTKIEKLLDEVLDQREVREHERASPPEALKYNQRLGVDKVQAAMLQETIVLKKVCSFDGCTGIMHFHDRRTETASGPHTLEWPWFATWMCSKESAHIEIVTDQEYHEIRRLHRERERRQRYEFAASYLRPKRPSLLRRAAHRIATLFGAKPR